MPYRTYSTGGERLTGTFQSLQQYGFMDLVLPFLLLFVLFFAILQKVKLFKHGKRTRATDGTVTESTTDFVADKKINSMLAITVSLLITIPHVVGQYPQNMDPIILMQQFLPHTAVIMAALFAVILLFGLAGERDTTTGAFITPALQLLIGIVSVGALVVLVIMNSFPQLLPAFGFLRDPSTQALLIVLLVMGLVGYFVMREDKPSKAHETIRKWMKAP